MKALKILRTTLYYTSHNNNTNSSTIFRALFSAQPLTPESQPLESESDSVFDSSHYEIPTSHDHESKPNPKPTWDEKYRARADKLVFGEEGGPKGKLRLKEEEDERRRRALAKALLQAALDSQKEDGDEEEGVGMVKEEDQKSLSVGIIGAPNAGKSALTNYMVCSFSSIVLFMLFSFKPQFGVTSR